MDLVQIQNSPLEFDHNALHSDGRGYYIYTTAACNLRCSYCFVSDKQNDEHMPDDMVDDVIKFITEDPAGRSTKYIHFFGGEPLLRAEAIWKICEGVRKGAPAGCKVTWGITTNGTLLTEEVCKLLKKYEIGVQLSLDGSEEGNNVHRQIMGGSQVGLPPAGAFHLVQIDNYMKYFGSNARMTVTVHNLQFLSKSLQDLKERGFKSFSIIPDTDCGPWEGHWEEFREEFEKVWWFWLENRETIQINIVNQVLDKLTGDRQCPDHLCNAGRNVIGIGVNGDIWPCHDFLGKFRTNPEEIQKLLIGNVRKGWTPNVKMFENLKVAGVVKSGAGYDCNKCYAAWACDRGCPYVNYTNTGDIRTVNSTYCKVTRIYSEFALKFMSLMRDTYVMKPKKALEKMAPTSQDEIWREIAARYYQQQAPFGKTKSGRALMPGPVTMRSNGWNDLQDRLDLSKKMGGALNKNQTPMGEGSPSIQFRQEGTDTRAALKPRE